MIWDYNADELQSPSAMPPWSPCRAARLRHFFYALAWDWIGSQSPIDAIVHCIQHQLLCFQGSLLSLNNPGRPASTQSKTRNITQV